MTGTSSKKNIAETMREMATGFGIKGPVFWLASCDAGKLLVWTDVGGDDDRSW
jgi:hypothetical protein